ncbi:MAG TPA: GNAT family N-acetyltransferase [Acidimicrobiales bacterium]|jgi:GNAT superfamily N-acetyltransferase|nr:GNAT family N-acetyltransferase [Acidimicrobiales bacterium]
MPAPSAPEGAPVSLDPPGYPCELERDVAAEGLRYHLRPIRPDDGPRLVELHGRLSRRSVYLRFFGPHPILSETEVKRFTEVDYEGRLALVATIGDDLIAVARYDRTPGTSEAEVAFVVDDTYQHHGVGSGLLDELADAALARGVTTFTAETLAENRTMLDVFHHAGFPVQSGIEYGTVTLRFPIASTADSIAARAARRQRTGSAR